MNEAPPELLPVLTVQKIDLDLPKILKINPSNMMEEYKNCAGWIATISYQYSIAKIRVERQERVIKMMEADLSRTSRTRMIAVLTAAAEAAKKKTAAKPTESQIKQEWISDPGLKNEYDKLDSLMAQCAHLEAARNGLNTKRDMLINLGAELRQDRRG